MSEGTRGASLRPAWARAGPGQRRAESSERVCALGGELLMAFLTPVVGLVFATVGLLVWNHGVRRYRGAGS